MTAGGPSFGEAVRAWARIGLLGFGGPAGQIAMMHRIVVDEKKWIGEARFLHALNYCMLLPGPEAQQLAIYLGWLMHRIPGGIAAGVLFVLPGALVLFGLSVLYAGFGDIVWIQGLFFGLKPAVLALVVDAVFKIGKRALTHRLRLAVAAAAFVGLGVLHLPFPLVVLGAGLLGWWGGASGHAAFSPAQSKGPQGHLDQMLDQALPDHLRPSTARAVKITAVCLTLWFAPIALAALLLGGDSVFVHIGLFFSKMAVVTFGGAYAVLAYVAQQAVALYHWLAPGEMLDGLGLAETTPGPLLMVVQFVGFLAAWRNPGALNPWLAAGLGALLTSWVTFVPCFLWIFLGGPYVERLRGHRALDGALSAITAAVVGIILNLALWFALHVLFVQSQSVVLAGQSFDVPVLSSLDPLALGLAGGALLAVLRFRLGMTWVLAGSAALGIASKLF